MRKLFITILGLLAFLPMTFGAYFTNVPQVRVQPNGDTLRCFATGDEYYHRLHDADGYTIVLDKSTGYYVYADKVGDALVPTGYVAGRTNPAEVGLAPNLSISAEQWRARRIQRETRTPARSGMRDYEINHGHINNLVVFIRFADDDPFVNEFSSVQNMFNDSTPGTSSMYNYFKAATYNQLAITSTFYPPQSGTTILSYQDEYNRSYFEPLSSSNPDGYDEDDDYERTYREHALLARAVQAIADMVPADLDIDYNDDGYVDNVVFVVRGDVGDWNALLWPHRWSLYNENAYINGLRVWDFNFQLADATSYFNTSVLCHEMNHSLGAPDLYHYYDDSNLSAVGSWDLMEQNANPPQHMGAYMKYKYGHWIDEIPEITECGTYSLYSLGSSATHNCYRIASPNPNEFFVLEYRNKQDYFEGRLPSSGLLIYRINTDFDGNAMYDGLTVFDEVYLYRPNGTVNTNGYLSRAAFAADFDRTVMNENTNPQPFLTDGTVLSVGDFTIRNVSYTGGDSMTFTFCNQDYLQIIPNELILDTDSAATSTTTISSDMSWSITGGCEWLSISTLADSGSVNVQVVALSENTYFEDRTCTLTVTASNGVEQTLTVIQRGQDPYLEAQITEPVSGNTGIFGHENSTCTIEIHSNSAWTVSTTVDWIGFSQAEGSGSATITAIALSENTTCVPRTATIKVSNEFGQIVWLSVMQNNYYHGTLSITPTNLTIDNVIGASAQLTITATDRWTVQSTPPWLSASPVEGNSIDYRVTLTVEMVNSSQSPRTGTVYISDICGRSDSQVQITVTQPEGYLSLSVPSVTVGPEQGSTATVDVECSGSWNIVTSTIPDWLMVTPSSATGNSVVTLSTLASNSEESERTAVIRFRYTLNFSAELLVVQQTSTGIVEIAEVTMLLYPNPVNDLLTVDVTGESQYTVYDATGRSVLRGSLTAMENTIPMSGLENGVYFVRFCDSKSGKVSVAKVVKQ